MFKAAAVASFEWMTAIRETEQRARRGPEVPYKGMSVEKHFSLLERQKLFS
jgi:hypothetical protein